MGRLNGLRGRQTQEITGEFSVGDLKVPHNGQRGIQASCNVSHSDTHTNIYNMFVDKLCQHLLRRGSFVSQLSANNKLCVFCTLCPLSPVGPGDPFDPGAPDGPLVPTSPRGPVGPGSPRDPGFPKKRKWL